MTVANRLMLLGAVLACGASPASAGCNTASRDAGSWNVPAYTEKATGPTATDKEHPPTSAMNKAAENTATSSEDAKRQMQGRQTVAEQSQQTEPVPNKQPMKMRCGPGHS